MTLNDVLSYTILFVLLPQRSIPTRKSITMFGLMSNRSRTSRSNKSYKPRGYASVSFRLARDEDAAAIRRLAALDAKKVPMGELLVAEADAEVIAALSIC